MIRGALGTAAAFVLDGMSYVHGIELMPGGFGTPGRRRHPRTPLANLSRNHPDYGCTVAEHQVRKLARVIADPVLPFTAEEVEQIEEALR